MATTTQHKQIRIDGMTGDECCQKVTEALEQVEGIEVESVEVGNATITASNEQSVTAARQAIDTLGFSARQDVASPKSQDAGKQSGQQQSQQGYRDQNSNQNAPSGIGRAATEGAREGDTGESNEDEPTQGDTAQSPGQNQGQNKAQKQGQSKGQDQGRRSGQSDTSPDGAEQMGQNQDGDQEQDQNLPTAEIDRGANAAKKQVGDAGRDDRDRGDPMPERVNGPGTDAKNTNSGQRPANQDKNPSTNSNANANQGVGAQGDKSGQQSSGKR